MSDDEDIDDRVASLVNEAFEDELVSHWIMIAEVVDSNTQMLRVWSSDRSSRWLVRGMLHEAEDMIIGDEYEQQILDDEEED